MPRPISERREMLTQSLPAASLRTGNRLPAARVLFRVSNYLICMALWLIDRRFPASNRVFSLLSGRRREASGAQRAMPAAPAGTSAETVRSIVALTPWRAKDVGAGKLATSARPLLRGC
jgi:hypothetical protein